jgi:hypothetical protein
VPALIAIVALFGVGALMCVLGGHMADPGEMIEVLVDAGTGTGWEFSTRAHSVYPTRGPAGFYGFWYGQF